MPNEYRTVEPNPMKLRAMQFDGSNESALEIQHWTAGTRMTVIPRKVWMNGEEYHYITLQSEGIIYNVEKNVWVVKMPDGTLARMSDESFNMMYRTVERG